MSIVGTLKLQSSRVGVPYHNQYVQRRICVFCFTASAAYRKTCLEYHPDKKLAGVTDPDERQAVEDHFKSVQDAYEILSDAAKRR